MVTLSSDIYMDTLRVREAFAASICESSGHATKADKVIYHDVNLSESSNVLV